MQQTEPALARLAVQSSGMHELTLEADQITPSDEDVSQASMAGVIWLLSRLVTFECSWPKCACNSHEAVLCKSA